jgi:transducin (beta)-like 1
VFAYESLVIKSSAAQTEIPPGALITFLQKGLEYVAIEEHIGEDGIIQEFDNNFSLLSPLVCEAVAVKDERRLRKSAAASAATAAATVQNTNGSVPMDEDDGTTAEGESKIVPSTYGLT